MNCSCTRRRLMAQLGGLSALAVLSPLAACSGPADTDTGGDPNPNTGDTAASGDTAVETPPGIPIDLDDPANAVLVAVDGRGYLRVAGDVIIIIHEAEDNWIVLSSLCTHQLCTVEYQPSPHYLACPCHGALFDLSGAVLRGPARLPLAVYGVTQVDNMLYIDAQPA